MSVEHSCFLCDHCEVIRKGHSGNWMRTDTRCNHKDKRGYRSNKTYYLDKIYRMGKAPKTCPLRTTK